MRDLPSPRFTWRDLLVIVKHCPLDSPLARATNGTTCGHTDRDHMLIVHAHLLAVANWQRSEGKRSDHPKVPDCLLPPEKRATSKIGDAAMTLDEAADWLGWELELKKH